MTTKPSTKRFVWTFEQSLDDYSTVVYVAHLIHFLTLNQYLHPCYF